MNKSLGAAGLRQQDSFTGQTSWQGSSEIGMVRCFANKTPSPARQAGRGRARSGWSVASLTRLLHRPGKRHVEIIAMIAPPKFDGMVSRWTLRVLLSLQRVQLYGGRGIYDLNSVISERLTWPPKPRGFPVSTRRGQFSRGLLRIRPMARTNLMTLKAVVAQRHSVLTFSNPRSRNCRSPITDFKIPNVVSAIRGRWL